MEVVVITIHPPLPAAITSTPELRLTHRLRLREALFILYVFILTLRILGIEKCLEKTKESIGSKGLMKRSQEGKNVASGVASRLHKQLRKLHTQRIGCARNLLSPAALLAQQMMMHAHPATQKHPN
ncbi:hypothetical protein PIB30_088163 [Stylosanthes scabra]|uniref:Uncharacterized protein n=1 Tax=Stylosanthes scabra TaxID=79078 RepID=A0ABU6UW68_9FABA|nr:hypothetical protein [Stylosanthes scabra]